MTQASARTVTIGRRFNGPPDSGNGGYVCGAIAVAVGADVRVRLVAPPPLDTALALEPGEHVDSWQLQAGDQVIAVAVPSRLELDVPGAPRYVQAVWASQHFTGFQAHPYPTCFVCGPHRRRGDGLRIFPGLLDSGMVAAPWLPADDLDAGDGKVAVEFHWAALDCPGYFAVADGSHPMLLGEMQAHVDRRVHAGESCTVIGWKIGVEGRKHYAGTAIFDEDGELCARARSTWIGAPPRQPAG
jgi:hypothetical protein